MSDQNDLKNLRDDLFSHGILQCSSCDNWLSSPVRMMDGVGDICDDCFKTKFNKSEALFLMNTKMDYILSKFDIPCKFASEGCKEILSHKDYFLHVKTCMYEAKPCLIESCVWDCSNNNLNEHFEKHHADNVIKNGYVFSVIIIDQQELIRLINIDNKESYILKMKIENGKLYFVLCITNNTQKLRKYSIVMDTTLGKVTNEGRLCAYGNIYATASSNSSLDLGKLFCSNEVEVTFIMKNANISGKNLPEYLECPVCKTLMRPSIHLCKNGHSICGSCRNKVNDCPSCRSGYSGLKNYALEGICKYVEYSCKFDDKGCDEKGFLDDIIKHEKICTFQDSNQDTHTFGLAVGSPRFASLPQHSTF